ncbi:MAG: Ig-like domain repeat protein, partial [Methanobrevibacter sp.]|nr:Ig-like domain repeat protein [Methanobrevibacter sp.]
IDVIIKTNTSTTEYPGSVNNGILVLTTESFVAGIYQINVTFGGNVNYNPAFNNTTFVVDHSSEINFRINTTPRTNIVFGDLIILNHTIIDEAEGIVTFVDVESGKTIGIANVRENITSIALGVGEHHIQGTYSGDNRYSSETRTIVIDIAPKEINVIVNAKDAIYGSNSSIFIYSPVDGEYSIKVNDSPYSIIVKDGVGNISLKLAANNYKVTVLSLNNSNYTFNEVSDEFKVISSSDSGFTITPNDTSIDYNTSVDLITSGEEGKVEFWENGILLDTKNVGDALTLSNLKAGKHTIVAKYLGNSNYTSVTAIAYVNVLKSKSMIIVSNESVNYPESKSISITVNTTGYYNVSVGSNSSIVYIAGTNYNYDVGKLNPGNYSVKVSFKGNENFTENEATGYYFVGNKTSLVITLTGDEINYLENATIKNNAPDECMGDITYSIKDEFDQSVTTKTVSISQDLMLSDLQAGTYTITATYSDIYYDSVTIIETTVTVNKVYRDFILHVDNITYGDILELTPIDNVIYTVDGAEYNDEILSAGEHNVSARSLNDRNYNSVTKSINVTVKPAQAILSVDIPDIVYGNNASIKVTGNGGNLTIEIVGIDTYIANVGDEIRTNILPANVYDVIITYINENYTTQVIEEQLIVKKANSSINIEIGDIYKVGEDIIVNLIPINSTGAVTVKINSKPYTVDNNQVTIPDGLANGAYTVVVELDEDGNYEAAHNSTTFEVIKNDITISVDDISGTIYVDCPVTFTANLNESVTGDVVFNINGINYTVSISNSDVATYTYAPVNNATLTVVATFIGNDKFNANSSASKQFTVYRVVSAVNVTDVTIVVGETAVIKVNVTEGATGSVNVTVNGETQTVGLVDSKATVYVFDLVNDTYDVTVKYLGDDKYDVSENTTQEVFVNKVESFDFAVIV